MKVKTILVSQPAPKTENSPYNDLSEKQKVKIKISQKKAKMIHRLDRNFFEVLNEKLRWGN